MTEPVVVGMDVGSSSARAVAVTRSGAVVASATAGYPADDLPIGEADPASWLVGAAEAINSLEVDPEAICIGGQGPTTVASTGERAITFRHEAGASIGPPDQHHSQSAVLRETYGDHVEPRQLWDWMAARLGGPDDSQSLWPGSSPLAGFGETVPVGSAVGKTNGDHGIPAGITLAAGANDAYMTAWGCGIDLPGKGFDPGGTTGGLGVAVMAKDHPDALAFGMASHVPDVYIIGGPVAAHGAMLDWWSQITGRGVPELLELAADAPPGAEGVMVLPFLEGERAPRWNLELRAEIVGLHIAHDVGTVTRALLESTAYGLGHIATNLASQGVELQRLVCSGGPSRSRLWSSIKASVLEVPIDVPEFHHMSAYGAAFGAGAALDWWPRPGDGGPGDWPTPEMMTIEPEPLEVYRVGLRRFIELGDAAEARLADVITNSLKKEH